jgi:hypothetical protein
MMVGSGERFGRLTLLVAITASMLVSAASAAPTVASGLAPAQVTGVGSALRPVQPCRLFDGRSTPELGRLDATTWRIQVGGRCGVATDARAVAIGIVAVEAQGSGFVTAWPSGGARPEASNLNFAPGNTVANSAVVQLGPSGSIDVFISARASLIVDVTSEFVDVGAEVNAGRFIATDPTRMVDTRQNGLRGTSKIALPLPAAVSPDATALAVTVTAVNAAAPGFLTAFPAGTSIPDASVVNTDRLNTTRASAVLLPVTPGGFVVHRSMETDVIVDVWGWFTGESAALSGEGLFVPQVPSRAWDSRSTLDPVHPGGTVERPIAPPGAAAVVVNVTALESTKAGFVSVFAAGTGRPNVSSLNYRWRQPVAALAISRVSDRGIAVFSNAGTHLLVDVAGWFTGMPAASEQPPPPNDMSVERSDVLFIGDSSFAGIRWNGALSYLQGADFDHRLESCRRLIGASCRGREDYAPATALSELWSVTPGRYSTVVIATGYNDRSSTFRAALDAVIAATRAKGIDRVVWMTYRENVGFISPAAASNAASFALNNSVLRSAAASGAYPELILADWHGYTIARPDWLTADGVHFTTSGARAAAEYTSRVLAALERRRCPAGIGGVAMAAGWCADPDITGPPG